MRIFYVIPDIAKRRFLPAQLLKDLLKGRLHKHLDQNWWPKEKPVGGIKVILQHCMGLKELGYEAHALCMGRYRGNFFKYDVDYKSYFDYKGNIQEDDVVVIPEYLAHMQSRFELGIKVLFVQNWRPIYSPVVGEKITTTYAQMGYEHILCCGDYMFSCLRDDDKKITHMVKNYIDHDLFKEGGSRRVNRVLALPRKHKSDIESIMAKSQCGGWEFKLVDNLTEAELIREYQQADVFLATGYPEGFGLPPIEAMACGCAVVGFTGRGASEFMIHEETALVAEDGDTDTAAVLLDRLFNDESLKERLRRSGQAIARRYTKAITLAQLDAAYKKIAASV